MAVKVRQKKKRKGAPWYVYINHKGARKAICVGPKADAEKVASKIRRALKAGDLGLEPEKKAPTFGELAKAWIEVTVPATCKASTLSDYQAILKHHVLPVFADRRLDQITRLQVKDCLLSKAHEGKAASTVGHIKNVLAGVFSRAVEAELIPANPSHRLGRLVKPKDRKSGIAPFTREELSDLLRVVAQHWPRHYPMVLCLARTGMRFGEFRALRWGDIDFVSRTIEVRRGFSRGRIETPKSGKGRQVDMSNQLAQALRALKTARKREALEKNWGEVPALIFVNSAGRPICQSHFRRRIWKKALERSGLKHHRIHDLRHTYASLLIQQGESLAYVRDQLGHHSIKLTVDTYGHLAPEGNKEAVDKLDEPEFSGLDTGTNKNWDQYRIC